MFLARLMTGKRGMIVLILENPDKEMVYFNRVKKLAKLHDFDVQFITTDALELNKEGKCRYGDCKCNKKE